MKIAFNVGSVPVTIIDTTAMGHTEEIHSLFAEYDALVDSPVGELADEEPINSRIDTIWGKLKGYGYTSDEIRGH